MTVLRNKQNESNVKLAFSQQTKQNNNNKNLNQTKHTESKRTKESGRGGVVKK